MRCHLPTGHSIGPGTVRTGEEKIDCGKGNCCCNTELSLTDGWNEAVWLGKRSPIVPLGTIWLPTGKPGSPWRCGWRPGRERPGLAASWMYLVGVIIYSSVRALTKKALHHRWNLLLELITLSPPSPPMMIFYSELITFYLLITVIMAHLQWVD